MSLSEFDIIRDYFSNVGPQRMDVTLGVGDDCAILSPKNDVDIVVTVDSLVKDVHFDDLTPVASIAYKAVMVSVSDIAAMGAHPAWLSLALTLPQADEFWLQQFATGLREACDSTGIRLVGGNMSRGPLNISTQLTGWQKKRTALMRFGARTGDKIYVSGRLGEAALGLLIHQKKISKTEFEGNQVSYLLTKLYKPTARVSVGLALQLIATACIDISDGLSADLGHLLSASKVGASIELGNLPVHSQFEKLFDKIGQWHTPLSGGEDYELCFTAPASKTEHIQKISADLGVKITEIGCIESQLGLRFVHNGKEIESQASLSQTGYCHFSNR